MPSYITSALEILKPLSNYSEKSSVLSTVLEPLQRKGFKLSRIERSELSAFAFSEIKGLNALLPTLRSYREKDTVMAYGDGSPYGLPQLHC